MTSVLSQTISLIKKDFLLEWRQKNAIYSLLLYVGGTVFICYISFSLKTKQLLPITWNAVYWIVMFFAAVHAISKSFSQEPRERDYYYFYIAKPEAIILAKIIYNFAIMLCVSFMSFLTFYVVFEIPIQNIELFTSNLVLGSLSFSSALTLLSGISAKAKGNSSLMTVLSVPIIIPLIMMLIKISNHAIDGINLSLVTDEIQVLLLINLIVLTASYLLFPYLWRS